MTFVTDSRIAGYLGPQPQSPVGDDWENFLHDVIAGVTGLEPTLVRPRWQPESPNMPDFDVNWVSFGVTDIQFDFEPSVVHDYTANGGLGQDQLHDHEVDTILCSFYGPNAGQYVSFLRRGLFVWQNRAVLRANGAGLVEISSSNRAPEYIQDQWLQRVDVNLIIRREIRYNYNVTTILRSIGPVIGNDRGDRTITVDFDTNEIPHPEEY